VASLETVTIFRAFCARLVSADCSNVGHQFALLLTRNDRANDGHEKTQKRAQVANEAEGSHHPYLRKRAGGKVSMEAMRALGYSQQEARDALRKVPAEIKKSYDLFKQVDPTRPEMTDGGNALLDESMPVYGGHYMEPPYNTLPEGTYDKAGYEHRQVWPVNSRWLSKPMAPTTSTWFWLTAMSASYCATAVWLVISPRITRNCCSNSRRSPNLRQPRLKAIKSRLYV